MNEYVSPYQYMLNGNERQNAALKQYIESKNPVAFNVGKTKTEPATITKTTAPKGNPNIAGNIANIGGSAISMAGDFMNNASGNAGGYGEDGPQDANVGMSTLKGAASGAAAGAVFGPWGAAIGGVVGGAGGAISSILGNNKAEEERNKIKEAKSIKNRQDAFNQEMLDNYDPMNDKHKYSIMKKGGKIKKYQNGPEGDEGVQAPTSQQDDYRYRAFEEMFKAGKHKVENINGVDYDVIETPDLQGWALDGHSDGRWLNQADIARAAKEGQRYYRKSGDKSGRINWGVLKAKQEAATPMAPQNPVDIQNPEVKTNAAGTPIVEKEITDEELGIGKKDKWAGLKNVAGKLSQLTPAFMKMTAKPDKVALDRPAFVRGKFMSDIDQRLADNQRLYNTQRAEYRRTQSSPGALAIYNNMAANQMRHRNAQDRNQHMMRAAEFADREAQRLQAHNYQLSQISNQEHDLNMRSRAQASAVNMAGYEDIANWSQRNTKEYNDRQMDDRRYKLAVASARRGMTPGDVAKYYGAYRNGGTIPELTGRSSNTKPIAELERGEIVLRPNGTAFKVGGKKHSQGGEKYGQDVLPEGSLVLSDHKKVPGLKGENGGKVTYAQLADSVLNQRKTGFNGLLDTTSQDTIKAIFDQQQADKGPKVELKPFVPYVMREQQKQYQIDSTKIGKPTMNDLIKRPVKKQNGGVAGGTTDYPGQRSGILQGRGYGVWDKKENLYTRQRGGDPFKYVEGGETRIRKFSDRSAWERTKEFFIGQTEPYMTEDGYIIYPPVGGAAPVAGLAGSVAKVGDIVGRVAKASRLINKATKGKTYIHKGLDYTIAGAKKARPKATTSSSSAPKQSHIERPSADQIAANKAAREAATQRWQQARTPRGAGQNSGVPYQEPSIPSATKAISLSKSLKDWALSAGVLGGIGGLTWLGNQGEKSSDTKAAFNGTGMLRDTTVSAKRDSSSVSDTTQSSAPQSKASGSRRLVDTRLKDEYMTFGPGRSRSAAATTSTTQSATGEKSFKQAFSEARKAGLKEFIFKGKKYHTRTRSEEASRKKTREFASTAKVMPRLDFGIGNKSIDTSKVKRSGMSDKEYRQYAKAIRARGGEPEVRFYGKNYR